MPIINVKPEFFNHDAEAGGFFPDTHINTNFDIEKFIQSRGRNVVVEGIRGTGKTHILKMVGKKYLQQFQTYHVLPVYVTLAHATEWSNDVKRFRIQLYSKIVLESIKIIEENESLLRPNEDSEVGKAVEYLKRLFGLSKEMDFKQAIREIKSLTETLLQRLTYNPDSFSLRDTKSTTDSSTIGIGAAGNNLGSTAALGEESETQVNFVGLNLSHENAAAFITEYFRQLKTILNLSYSLLLLDECSESSKEGQIEAFRLLKLIRGASSGDLVQNFIYFIAAAYPPQATYYPSRMRGDAFNFEIGQDASMEYLQLDENLDEYESFFKELTKKRLQFLGGNGFFNDNTSHMDIFENDRSFLIAAYASNGIPRRYIQVLKHAYDNLQQRYNMVSDNVDTLMKISVRDIELAIQTVVSNQILAHSKLNPEDSKILFEIINRFSWRNKKQETENKEKQNTVPISVYFTVSRSQIDKFANLIIQGAVHDKGRTRSRKYYRDEALQGELMNLDLAVSFYYGAIDKPRAADIFSKDLKENAKKGYVWCLDFDVNKFRGFRPTNKGVESEYKEV